MQWLLRPAGVQPPIGFNLMQKFEFAKFGLENLTLATGKPPEPGPGQIRLEPKALSLNYLDLLVVSGAYNPRLVLPATLISVGAGVVAAVGEGVQDISVGQSVMSHFPSAITKESYWPWPSWYTFPSGAMAN